MAVQICIFSECPKVPRGHHPVSQSSVYQDSKNAIKRCMDPKTRCSHKSSFYSRTISLSRRFERNKNVPSPSTRKTQYRGEPPRTRSSVLGLRPTGIEFRILCLEGGAVSCHSSHHPQEVFLAQFSLYMHKVV